MELNSNWQNRTKLLLGEKHKKIENLNVLIVGLGGVGGMAAEMLCRAGVGKMTIIDNDTIDFSNLNRQIFTNTKVINQKKVDVLGEKLLCINPLLKIKTINHYISDNDIIDILKTDNYNYVVDAIDTIAPKVFLLYNCSKLGIKTVSSMGAGGIMNPSLVQVADISKSHDCGLARIVRKRLNRLGVKEGIKVVFSPEKVIKESMQLENLQNKKSTLGTISYLPAIFGIYISWIIVDETIAD